MSTEFAAPEGGIIEVPVELRGPSNEEILQRGEREDSARRRRAASRPSKRERQRMKLEKGRADMQKVARSLSAAPAKAAAPRAGFSARSTELAPVPGHEKRESDARKKLDMLFAARPAVARSATSAVAPAPAPAVPSSGRVLKGSFGAKPSESAKAQVYSAAELSRMRMEERAKKIRDALAAKNRAALPAEGPDGAPVKRPRGRPRKNPLPLPE